MAKKQLYAGYITAGITYVALKIVFVLAGYLHLGAIWHGLVPAVLTTATGLVAMRKASDNSQSTFLSRVLVVLPVLVLITTPPFMYWKQRELWLDNGRLPVLIIYECLALAQIVLAIQARR